jgi:hypothetical protein
MRKERMFESKRPGVFAPNFAVPFKRFEPDLCIRRPFRARVSQSGPTKSVIRQSTTPDSVPYTIYLGERFQ